MKKIFLFPNRYCNFICTQFISCREDITAPNDGNENNGLDIRNS